MPAQAHRKDATQSPHYTEAVDLPAHFHQHTEATFELALKGTPTTAHDLMAVSKPFARYSASSTLKFKEWKKDL